MHFCAFIHAKNKKINEKNLKYIKLWKAVLSKVSLIWHFDCMNWNGRFRCCIDVYVCLFIHYMRRHQVMKIYFALNVSFSSAFVCALQGITLNETDTNQSYLIQDFIFKIFLPESKLIFQNTLEIIPVEQIKKKHFSLNIFYKHFHVTGS